MGEGRSIPSDTTAYSSWCDVNAIQSTRRLRIHFVLFPHYVMFAGDFSTEMFHCKRFSLLGIKTLT